MTIKNVQLKFTRITGCTGTPEGFVFIHDYGQIALPRDDILYAFAVKIKGLEGQEIPILIFIIKDQDGFYYIDGLKVSPRQYHFEDSRDELFDKGLVTRKTADFVEKLFKWVVSGICTHLKNAYIDKPIAECVKGSTFFLPSFNTLLEAGVHYNDLLASDTLSEEKSVSLTEEEDEELDTIAAPTERKEWKEGMVIEGKYTIQEVKKGGMGIVYIVFDPENAKFYAVKTFQERYIWNEQVIRQFVKEAEIWVNLEKHPNIVNAELVRIIEGKPCIFLEYISGTDLEELIRHEILPMGKLLELGIQFCEGMSYAFRKLGLIHRDIKPSNCFISSTGILKITDFGLGKIFDEAPAEGDLGAIQPKKAAPSEKTTSSSSAMAGTLGFMAPELFTDLRASSIKSDIYSFGVMFYMMLTGINPFYHDDPSELIVRHIELEPKPASELNSDITIELSEVVAKCLEKDPADRYNNFDEIKAELEKNYEDIFSIPYVFPEAEEALTEEGWLNKGISLASLDHHKEAIITFDQALKINPESSAVKVQKGKSLIHLRKFDEAIANFDEVMIDDPGDWEAWYWRGEALWKKGRRGSALPAFDRALHLEPSRPEILGSRGNLLAEMGRVEEALSCFDQALEKNPTMEELWDKKGETLLNLHRYEEATKCFDRAIEINPRLQSAWAHRGDVLYQRGFFLEAKDAYKTALTLNPDSVKERLGIGRCYHQLGDIHKAQGAFEQALEIKPSFVDIYLARAKMFEDMLMPEPALQSLKVALNYEPYNRSIIVPLARFYLKSGAYESAYALCDSYAEKSEEDQEEDWELNHLKESAAYWIKRKEKITGRIYLQKALDDELIYRDISSLLSVFYPVEDACKHLQERIASKEDARSHFLLARLNKLTGDLNGAITSAEKAVSLGGSQEAGLFLRGLKAEAEKKKEKKGGLGFLSSFMKREEKVDYDADDFLAMGIEKLQTSEHLKAYNFFKDSLKKNPDYHVCWLYAGIALKNLGELEKSEQCFQTFLERFPDSPGFVKYQILNAPAKADREEMENLYQKWIGLNPRDHNAWFAYVKFFTDIGDDESASILATGIEKKYANRWNLSKKSPAFWNLRGLMELMAGDSHKASLFFSRSLRFAADDPLALLGMGKCREMRGELHEAFRAYEKLALNQKATLMALYQTAHLHMKKGNLEEAIKTVDKALNAQPGSIILSYKKGQIYVELGDYRSFLRYYTSVFHIEGKYPSFYLLRAVSLVNTEKLSDAISYMKSAIDANPANHRLAYAYALLHLKARDIDSALELFDRVIAAGSFLGESYMGKGIVHFMQGRYLDAIATFQKALTFQPDEPSIYMFIGASHFYLENNTEAEAHLRKAIELKGRYVSAWANCGIFFCLQKKYPQALQYIERALKIDKENFPAWLCRAKAQYEMGNLDEANKSAEQALFYAAQDVSGWVLRGLIHHRMSQYKQSLECYAKACEINDKNPVIWYNRGVAALALEDLAEAEKFFSVALLLDYRTWEALIGKAIIHRSKNEFIVYKEVMDKAESFVPDIYEKWAGRITTSGDLYHLLEPMETGSIPFDLPSLTRINLPEPVHILNFEALDAAF